MMGWECPAACRAPSAIASNKRGGRFPASPLEPLRAPPVQQDPADSICCPPLLGRGILHRANRYERAAVAFGMKFDVAFDFGKQSMVGTHAHIKAGMPRGAALTRDDVAGDHVLAAIGLDSEPLAR